MFPGFPTRLENEIIATFRREVFKDQEKELPFAIEVKVIISCLQFSHPRILQEENIMSLLEEVCSPTSWIVAIRTGGSIRRNGMRPDLNAWKDYLTILCFKISVFSQLQ
jgi:hypothetical protein